MMRRQRVQTTNFVPGGVMNSPNVQTRQAQNVPATPNQQPKPSPQKQTPIAQQQKQQAAPVQTQVKQVPVQNVGAPAPPRFGNNLSGQQPVMTQPAVVTQPPAIKELQDTSMNDSTAMKSDDADKKAFRWPTSNKKPSVRAKERRMRQNRRLRKILIPKNALMALHEVKGISMSDFTVEARDQGGFAAKVAVNNMQYEGIGSSKVSAKNNACEKALRDHIIFKMIQSSKLGKSESDADQSTNEEQDVEMKDGEEVKEDVPMLNLASFALYKLFQEWESDGFEIPDFRPTNANGQAGNNDPATPIPSSVKRELPSNWEAMHPASLLCVMRPGIQYTYLGCEGKPPNTLQRVGLCCDGENFIGQGRSQKLARRDAAVQACNALFSTNFNRDNAA